MRIIFLIFALTYLTVSSFSQEKTSETFLADSSLVHASVSLCVADANSGDVIIDYNSGISLTPASVLKVITSAAALELLGPGYTFKTTVGYTGSLNKRSGKLKGNIIICLLYTSDAADEEDSVDLGGRRIIKKKKKKK